MPASKRPCTHTQVQVEVSDYALDAGFPSLDWKHRAAAATVSGVIKSVGPNAPENQPGFSHMFPAPLILPDDLLALDQAEPPQSVRKWRNLKERNKVTHDRKAIYVAAQPGVSDALSVMKTWIQPRVSDDGPVDESWTDGEAGTRLSMASNVVEYLATFYHGFSVKWLSSSFTFVPWDSRPAAEDPEFVGLQLGSSASCTRIRTRPCPDGVFKRQLNLNDIIDAEIHALPGDAYALLMLVDHDLYEDEDDDFCCGRAYGGSRISVVSSARYHPALRGLYDLDFNHMWPASHCRAFIDAHRGYRKKQLPRTAIKREGAMGRAVEAVTKAGIPSSPDELRGLWLACVARTASHELGHCFGMGHCSYYACVMQGTAGLAEDYRQPPYLCPVCLKKLTKAAQEGLPRLDEEEYVVERYSALLRVCEEWKHIGMFAGYGAWLREVLSPSPRATES